MYQHIRTTRRKLYQEVWSTPVRILSREYGISDVGLAKICKRNEIPRPPRGYWARVQSGQKIDKTPLPNGDKDWEIRVHSNSDYRDVSESAHTIVQKAPLPKLPKRFVVPEKLEDPHPLIKRSAEILQSSRPEDTGLVIPAKEGCLNIRVSRDNIPRALRIMDALIKALENLSFEVSNPENRTEVRIMDTTLSIGISEKLVRKRLRAQDHDLDRTYYEFGYNLFEEKPVVSGVLYLEIVDTRRPWERSFRRLKWWDTESVRLEDSLKSFISGLIRAAALERAGTPGPEDDVDDE